MPTPVVLALALSLLPGPQDQFVESRIMLPRAGGHTPSDAVAGDVDQDGIVDLFGTGTSGEGAMTSYEPWFLLGLGNGSFAEQPLPEHGMALAAALGDVDADGDLDAAVGSSPYAFGVHSILRWEPGGYVQGQQFYTSGQFRHVALGDVDGDQDLDLFVGHTSADAHVFRNDGLGFFTPDFAAVPPLLSINHSALADLDGDGDLDLFVAVDGLNDRLLLNDGAGIFTEGPPPPTADSLRVEPGDADGDGDVDLYLSAEGGDRLARNGGSGSFTAEVLPPAVASRIARFWDWNDDGLTDLVACSADGVAAWTGGAGGTLAPGGVSLPAFIDARAVVATDLDGDGDGDLALFGQDTRARLWLNASGGFAELQGRMPMPPAPFNALDFAAEDVDGNGTTDLFVVNSLAERNALYLGDGTGNFAEASANLPDEQRHSNAVALMDADIDGDNDAVVVGMEAVSVDARLQRNDGTGVFTTIAGAIPRSGSANDLVEGDLDADGDRDLLLVYQGLPGVTRHLNSGTGSFVKKSFPVIALNGHKDPVLADSELDGDLDLFLLSGTPVNDKVIRFLNTGTGKFALSPAPAPGLAVRDIDLGDADLDGDPDLLVVDHLDSAGVMWNDGLGGFQPPVVIADSVGSGGFVDVDGDRTLDFGGGSSIDPAGEIVVCLNQGGFAPAQKQAGMHPNGFVDLDRDGDAEAINLLFEVRVAINTAGGAVLLQTPPRLGKPFELEVHGPPLSPYGLAAALAAAEIPLPPFGLLQLDPTHLVVLATGIVPARGFASFSPKLGADPTLLGITLHLQAITGNPLAFTPREAGLVTAF